MIGDAFDRRRRQGVAAHVTGGLELSSDEQPGFQPAQGAEAAADPNVFLKRAQLGLAQFVLDSRQSGQYHLQALVGRNRRC